MATFVTNDVKTVDHSSFSKNRAKFLSEVLAYAESSLTMREIAKAVGCSYHCVRDIYKQQPWYEQRVYNLRSLGRANVNYATGEAHGSYKGHTTNHVGYRCWKTPDWYAGRKTTGNTTAYVFEHQLIVCAELSWNRLPDGYCVHHIDQNKLNNNLSNLALIARDDHNLLHGLLRKGVTTIPIRKYVQVNGSASLWSFSPLDEEIVCSCWQQQAELA
jgi:HNH endonuclease